MRDKACKTDQVGYALMFFYRLPQKAVLQKQLAAQAQQPYSYDAVGATATSPPTGFVVDHNRVQLGRGKATFMQACDALRCWKMFDIGWVDLLWPNAPFAVDTTVGVLAHLPGFHILNACRIVYLIDEECNEIDSDSDSDNHNHNDNDRKCNSVTRFGFAYGTMPGHIERGEERFCIEWHQSDDRVWYDILAFSQPAHWLVKVGYPVARYYQRRFARASLCRMQRVVTDGKGTQS